MAPALQHMRKNQYEEALFRCEDDRFELDMAIECSRSAVKALSGVVSLAYITIQCLLRNQVIHLGIDKSPGFLLIALQEHSCSIPLNIYAEPDR